MKKLFLYVLLFVGIFFVYVFCLQMNILNNVCRKKRDRSWNLQRIPFPLTQNGKTNGFFGRGFRVDVVIVYEADTQTGV